MLILRLSGLLIVLGIAGCLILWIFTGNARYQQWAWNTFRFGVILLFALLSLFAIERILIPLV